ncbi:cyclase dehydrase [Microvirga splendida]|uniref:Cyclase dehydrase n=1 Tax=Microvirga splendida TaxID=2795727 RepID=A0ABS0XWU3_9HYPH|nr:cyclase dehydrase [Microvirga splendida]MBJ6124510.1 cyclase dehydrase [Microvirga splendida]
MRYETERTRRRGHADTATDTLARGLGIFSIALGIAEVVAPRALARALGMRGQEGLIAGYGVREIATGIGILASKDPTPWIWGRVAGDGLDLATLATALESNNPKRGNVGIAMAAVAGVTALDVYCAQTLSSESPHPLPMQDYSDRTGYPRGIGQSRGAAKDFEVPRDFRTPEAMRPYTQPQAPQRPMPSM